MSKRITVKTVADRAGVSVATVSRVLGGGEGRVTAATRQRVLDAARTLDYQPNSLAVALRKGVTKMIGLIVPDISNPYFHAVARGVEDVAQEAGYAVLFCNTDRRVDKESLCLDLLREKRTDGIIFCGGGVGGEDHLRDRDWGGAEVVAIGPHVLDFPTVRADDAAAIAEAVEQLASSGRRRVLCIGGDANWLITQRRLVGYREAVRRLGLDDDPELVFFASFTTEGGRQAVTEALERGVGFDAVVTFDDESALGALLTLQEAGLAVPDDVAVVGCSDLPFASLIDPPLTSISFPTYEFGATAARMVLARLAGRPVEPIVDFPFELRVRASSAGGAKRTNDEREPDDD
jgi:LacI family transcriptional regulator